MKTQNYTTVAIIFAIFFAISLITNILGSINPNVSDSFQLSGASTGMLPFSFFIAYAIMSIPSGMIVQQYLEKKSIIAAWLLSMVGAFVFAMHPTFSVFLLSLFLMGCSMALLQVAINPLLRVSGGEEHFAFFSVFAQIVFGLASFTSPYIYSYLVGNLAISPNPFIKLLSAITHLSMSWVALYWLFAVVSLIMVVLVLITRFPKVVRTDDEIVGAWAIHLDLFKQKAVLFYFLGIFAYVGTEQGIANWISEFLRTYHNLIPEKDGAQAVSLFWGMITLGCILGLLLIKILDSKIVLRMFTIAALIMLTLTLFGNVQMAVFGFPALGFCLSVMWSIIFSLALNSVAKYHGSFAGILCTAIAGGAIVSLLIGKLKDLIGLRGGMMVLYLTLAYILCISIWAKPLIKNKIISKAE